MVPEAPAGEGRSARLPRSVWALGFVSLCMDASSEFVHSLLPILLVTTLGASVATLGWIEGIAEATASFFKVASGVWSDRLRLRKPLVVLGYGLAALTKPAFPLAHSVATVAAARFVDRVGKGIRGAPRDAMLADVTPLGLRGAAYGLRQALDSVGAVVGPLLAFVALGAWGLGVEQALWIAVVPAFVAVLVLLFGVREPVDRRSEAPRSGSAWAGLARVPLATWRVVALACLFTLARFSEAFLILRARDLGMPTVELPLVLAALSLVYAACAYPAGRLADRWGRQGGPGRWPLLAAGLLVLVISDLVLARSTAPLGALLGACLWGLHLALTQGLFSKLIADSAPSDLRGTAFGVLHLASGLALLLASGLAGWLWSGVGPQATFLAGAGFAALALLAILAAGAGRAWSNRARA